MTTSTQRIGFPQWAKLMADALGVETAWFSDLPKEDRWDLIATAIGRQAQPGEDPYALAAEIARKAGGKAPTAPKQSERKPAPKATGKPPVVQPPADLLAVLSDYLQRSIDAALEGFEPVTQEDVADMVAKALGGIEPQSRFLTVQVADRPAVDLKGHVHPQFETILRLASQRLPILLVGPAGSGKTTLAKKVAEAMGLPFGSVSCTAGMSEGELVGKLLPDESGAFTFRTTRFLSLYEGGGVFLCDEIDAADPNVLLKINSAVGSVRSSGYFFNDLRSDKPEVVQHKDSVLIAAANTFGTGANAQYVGRNQLDAATLDRFVIVEVDYDRDLERQIGSQAACEWVWALRERTNAARLRRVVSTRMIEKHTAMEEAGMSLKDIRSLLTAGWTADERSKVNL